MPVRDKLKKQAHNVVWGQVSNKIKSPVWTHILALIYEHVWVQTRDQVMNQVQDKVR